MESKKFVEALRRVGYPQADSLNPDSFEWVFLNSSTRSFVNWFCSNLGAENVLSDEELREYELMEANGEVMEGAQLDEALKFFGGEDAPNKNIEENVEQLKETLAKAKKQRESLKSRCSKLSVQQMSIQSKELKLKEEEKQGQKTLQAAVDSCTRQNITINEALQKLYESTKRLVCLYEIKSSIGESNRTPASPRETHFLSQLDLKNFLDKEQKYSHDLTALTKKLFFEGMADMAGEKDTSTYELLDVSSSSSLLLDQENDKKETFRRDCEEFSRLQNIFPTSEGNRINALINAKKALSAVNEAMTILHSLKTGVFPKSPSEISGEHHEVEKSIEKTQNDANHLLQSVPELVRELGSLQGNEVLTGDYDLKLKRQEHFTKKQDTVIKHLLKQRSRSELLALLLDLEIKCHQENHHLLSAVRQILDQHYQDFKQQMADLNDPDLNVKRFERSVVDTRDNNTSILYQLFGVNGEEEKPLYLPKAKVVEKAHEFCLHHDSIKTKDQTMDENFLHKIEQLESCLKQFQTLLYGGSSTSGGHPVLTPPEVQSSIAELTTLLDGLLEEGETVLADFSTKKQTLRSDALQNKERQLFTLFHNNPERLKQVMSGLAEGVKAHSQSQDP